MQHLALPKPVTTKHDFVRRYLNCEFGNRPPTWGSLEEWQADYYRRADTPWSRISGSFHIRNRNVGGKMWYNVPAHTMVPWWRSAEYYYGVGNFYITQMAPPQHTIIQGEAALMPGGLYLYYSTLALPMRDALRESSHSIQGIMADSLLRQHMDQYSYIQFQELLESYPDHVIEFSVYSIDCGIIPNRNTIYWEIRAY